MEDTKVLRQKLLKNVADLPEHRFKEVLDFVDVLKARETGDNDSILESAGCLSGDPLSANEIEEELYGKGPA